MSKVKKLKRKIRSLQAANVNILHRLERLEKAVTGDAGARGEIHVELVTKVISDEIERDLFKSESAPSAEWVLASVAEFKPEVREELAAIRGLETAPLCGDPGVVCDWCDQDAERVEYTKSEAETIQKSGEEAIQRSEEHIVDQIGAMIEEALAEAGPVPVYVCGRRQDWTFIDPPKGGGYMDVIGFDANGSPVGDSAW